MADPSTSSHKSLTISTSSSSSATHSLPPHQHQHQQQQQQQQPLSAAPHPTPPPALDPPFRGYIETTLDALLVFEAARRGMIPRVTRRLIERERGMVQSGAVFVFDEHESGIKRWTDGMIWSPSRILGNFLVYRETDKRPPIGSPISPPLLPDDPILSARSSTSTSNHYTDPNFPLPSPVISPTGSSSSSKPQLSAASVSGFAPPLRGRSTSDGYGSGSGSGLSGGGGGGGGSGTGGGMVERTKEKNLVGSLTGSFKFKDGGLVKKTMSVNVNGFAQHMVSYYSVEDVVANRLRTPSSLAELLALDISPEYLQKQNFRFPPMIEVGLDGIPRYAGEPEEAANLPSATLAQSIHSASLQSELKSDPNSFIPALSRISTSATGMSPLTPPEYPVSNPGYFETQQMQHLQQNGLGPGGSVGQSQSFAQLSTQMMQPSVPPSSAMGRQTSEGGSRDRRTSLALNKSVRYDPYGHTPPNTAPIYGSTPMSASLPADFISSTGQQGRTSEFNAQGSQMQQQQQQQQQYSSGKNSPPSPRQKARGGGARYQRPSTAGYSNGEGLGSVVEGHLNMQQQQHQQQLQQQAQFAYTLPGSSLSNPNTGIPTYSSWPAQQAQQEAGSYPRSMSAEYKDQRQQLSGSQSRYGSSLGSPSLLPMSASYPRSFSGSQGMIYPSLPESANLVVYPGEPSYQNSLSQQQGGQFQQQQQQQHWGRPTSMEMPDVKPDVSNYQQHQPHAGGTIQQHSIDGQYHYHQQQQQQQHAGGEQYAGYS